MGAQINVHAPAAPKPKYEAPKIEEIEKPKRRRKKAEDE